MLQLGVLCDWRAVGRHVGAAHNDALHSSTTALSAVSSADAGAVSSGGLSKEARAAREECDHFWHAAALINDKTDGFYDALLPTAQLRIVEAYVGCAQPGLDGTQCALMRLDWARVIPKWQRMAPDCDPGGNG